jgi:hypothetical protein
MIHRYATTHPGVSLRFDPRMTGRGESSAASFARSAICDPYDVPPISTRINSLRPMQEKECVRTCTRTHGHLFPRNPVHPTTSHERRERRRRVLSPSYPSGASPLLISSASCSAALVPTKDPTLQYVFIQGIRRQKRPGSVGREASVKRRSRASGREATREKP